MKRYHFFYGGYLSNFHTCPITIDGIQFSNSETVFMLYKALHFNDSNTAVKICNTKHPAEAKRLGRNVIGFNNAEWEKVREEYMYKACYAKFSQNAMLKQQLRETEDIILVEAALNDTVWGIGRGMAYPFLRDESKWLGKNLLGKVLMRVREELKQE